MKKIIFVYCVCFISALQAQTGHFYKGPDNLTFYYRDTTAWSQVTIAEYKGFLAIFEMPFNDKGAGQSTDLLQDLVTAQRFQTDLEAHFHKPLRYIFSTHWHQHSLSALTPFLKNGTELFTSASSWQYLQEHGFIGADTIQLYKRQIHQLKGDTTVLAKTEMPVRILFLDTNYQNKPTRDYLLFYFPNRKTLIGSCMCAVNSLDPKTGPVYSDRLSDLRRSVMTRQLEVDKVIGLTKKNEKDFLPVFGFKDLSAYMDHARPIAYYSNMFMHMEASFLHTHLDSLLHHAILEKVPAGAINSVVYACLRQGRMQDAVAMAQFLNLYSPGVDSFIDTLGEACLAAGDEASAEKYNTLLSKRYPDFKNGGMNLWLEHRKTKWK